MTVNTTTCDSATTTTATSVTSTTSNDDNKGPRGHQTKERIQMVAQRTNYTESNITCINWPIISDIYKIITILLVDV